MTDHHLAYEATLINIRDRWRSCIYCGSPWNLHRDHVIPNSYLRDGIRRFEGDWHVPACAECNEGLSDKLLFTVPLRAAYLFVWIRKRYKKLLLLPSWLDDDLDEMEEWLCKSILRDQARREAIESRLSHLKMISEKPEDYGFHFPRRLVVDDFEEDVTPTEVWDRAALMRYHDIIDKRWERMKWKK